MKRQTVIILDTPDNSRECWGNLKKLCRAKGWSYNALSRKKLPCEWDGNKIWRVEFQ